MTKGTESVGNLVSLTKNYTLTSGYYVIKVEYGDNVYSYDVFLADGETKELSGYVSPVYLGGAMCIRDRYKDYMQSVAVFLASSLKYSKSRTR